MSIVSNLIQRLKKHKAVRASEGFPAYRELLKDVLSGKDQDPNYDLDHVEALLDALGKTPKALNEDTDTFEKRLSWRAQYEAKGNNERIGREKEALIQKLQGELNAITEKYRSQIREAYDQQRAAEQVVMTAEAAAVNLRNTVLDPGLIARQADLNEQQRALVDRMRELEESITERQVQLTHAQRLQRDGNHSASVDINAVVRNRTAICRMLDASSLS